MRVKLETNPKAQDELVSKDFRVAGTIADVSI